MSPFLISTEPGRGPYSCSLAFNLSFNIAGFSGLQHHREDVIGDADYFPDIDTGSPLVVASMS